MKKIVFCQVAWMKEYCGITEQDKPVNGGQFVKENGEGFEKCNFLTYNHFCYGYVMHNLSGQLHIERYDKTLKNHSEVDDMTVIWVATKNNKSRIVGWYEHAIMYREVQEIYDSLCCGEEQKIIYNFKASENDCYLVPEENRDFIIPRAMQEGKGRGFGRAQVWYADSEYAQENMIPEVMKYLETARKNCIKAVELRGDMKSMEEDKGQSVVMLLERADRAEEEGDYSQMMQLLNLVIHKEDSFKTRHIRAVKYSQLSYYDEAEKDYEMANFYKEDPFCMLGFM